MLELPDGPDRHDAETQALFTAALARIFQYSFETCQDLRALLEEACTEEEENPAGFARRVDLSVYNNDGSDELFLGVDIEIRDKQRTVPAKNGTRVTREAEWMFLKQENVRAVVAMLQRPLREAIAACYLGCAQQQWELELEEQGKYDEIPELGERFVTLREQIVEAAWYDLPPPGKKRARWKRPNGPGAL